MKSRFISILAMLMALVGCNKEIAPESHPETDDSEIIEIGIKQEPGTADETKISLGTDDGKFMNLNWSKNDRILMIQNRGKEGERRAIFELISGEGTASGKFRKIEGNIDRRYSYEIIYPVNAVENGVYIKNDQKYSATSIDESIILLERFTADSQDLTISQRGALLCLPLSGTKGESVENITVTHTRFITETRTESKSYCLHMEDNPIVLKETPTDFYIGIQGSAKYNYPEVTINISFTDGSHLTKNLVNKSFVPGYLHRYPVLDVSKDAGPRIGGIYDDGTDKGIIWEIGDTHIKIMSMDEIECFWSTENVLLGLGNKNQEGYEATMKLAVRPGFAEKYPAAYFCTSHGEGWYLPSAVEIRILHTNLFNNNGENLGPLNTTLTDNGGTAYANKHHWVIDENNAEKAYSIGTNNRGGAYPKTTQTGRCVRAVKKIMTR